MARALAGILKPEDEAYTKEKEFRELQGAWVSDVSSFRDIYTMGFIILWYNLELNLWMCLFNVLTSDSDSTDNCCKFIQ